MIFKSFLNVLFAINVLYVIRSNADENDVHFDFNKKYFKVDIATNKPTVLPVTLYNPHVWPGPNDTHPTSSTTPLPKRVPKRRFAFGLRRSPVEYRNSGYGYDNNISQYITNPTIETTISPFNRKFYNIDFNTVLKNNTNNYPDGIREFRGFRNLSRNYHVPRNYSDRFPVTHNISRYPPGTRVIRRRIPIYRTTTTKRPTRWQIFTTNKPRFNFTRDLGDFQEIIQKDLTKWRNFSGNYNDLSVVNRTTKISFNCNQMGFFGYYADIESNCKIFHVCTPDGRKVSFVCPAHLRFNQMQTVCDWSRNVNCLQSHKYYDVNLIKFDHWNRQVFSKR